MPQRDALEINHNQYIILSYALRNRRGINVSDGRKECYVLERAYKKGLRSAQAAGWGRYPNKIPDIRAVEYAHGRLYTLRDRGFIRRAFKKKANRSNAIVVWYRLTPKGLQAIRRYRKLHPK